MGVINTLSNNIYVINLKHREDRRTHILNELSKIGCDNYKLIEAINGKDINKPSKISVGALGLANTYIKIHNEYDTTESVCLIEDDCVFLENFNENLEQFIKNTPIDWDILYFGGNHNYHIGCKTTQINEFCIKLNHTYTTHCLIMKKYVFDELINIISNVEIEVDVAMVKLQKKYNAYSSSDKLTTQLTGYSDIENAIIDYSWLIK